MNKNTYLDIPEVSDFIKWFASDSAQKLTHSYEQLKPRKEYSFSGLPHAFTSYEWKGDLIKNTSLLNALESQLQKSLSDENGFESYRDAAVKLMEWGGTQKGNNAWLQNKDNFKIVQNTLIVLNKQDDDIAGLKGINGLRFNSGLTKLYSLIVDDFIIYDSRVAGALAWYVSKFYDSKIPEPLKFACMDSRFSKIINRHHIRRPSNEFPLTTQNDHSVHAHWNIRASWIVSEVIKLMPNSAYCKHKDIKPIRALEAALFMWGYDLHHSI